MAHAVLLVKAFRQWLGLVGRIKMVGSNWIPGVFLPLVQTKPYSYNGEYGGIGGNQFSYSGNQMEGPVTGLHV